MFPDVEYSTDRDFFLENQIVCIVSREGTKFCSLIENRLFMRSQSRHISKRMQLHIMCEIHKEICRLRYGGNPYAVARLFSIFAGLNQKKKVIRLKNLNDNILE